MFIFLVQVKASQVYYKLVVERNSNVVIVVNVVTGIKYLAQNNHRLRRMDTFYIINLKHFE